MFGGNDEGGSSRQILLARFLVFAALSAALGAVCSHAFLILRGTEMEAFQQQFFDAAALVSSGP